LPSINNLDSQFRLEPEIKLNIYANFDLGNHFFYFGGFETSAGVLEKASFSTIKGQVVDDKYESKYKLSLYADAGL